MQLLVKSKRSHFSESKKQKSIETDFYLQKKQGQGFVDFVDTKPTLFEESNVTLRPNTMSVD